MNASSNAFRSHLMQQFVAAARHQSRPPLALLGLQADDDGSVPRPNHRYPSNESGGALLTSSSSARIRRHSTCPPSLPGDSFDYELRDFRKQHNNIGRKLSPRLLSTLTATEDQHEGSLQDNVDSLPASSSSTTTVDISSSSNRAESFQYLLQTRRTCSRFAPPPLAGATVSHTRDREYWVTALDRAIQCGLAAPNHKRTEPFQFKRLVNPSDKINQLADIVFQVQLRQQQQQQQQQQHRQQPQQPDNKPDPSADVDDATTARMMREAAERKREKWSQIPAYLVTLVQSHESTMINDTPSSITDNRFDLLPYVPPADERELEDYAAACAAVQNILLSLHAEGIASKWVTGSVIRTPAFRELINAAPHDRVVALIMVGEPHPSIAAQTRRRKLRRSLDEVVEDL